jgi:hypothetical protein
MISDYSLHRSYLRTQFRRRSLVVAFYILIAVLTAVALFRGEFFVGALLVQMLTLGGLFGGITRNGPVKPYSETNLPFIAPDPDEAEVITLYIDQPRPFESKLLDERERNERDAAHYKAYAILRWALTSAAILFWLALAFKLPHLQASSPVLLWTLVVFVLSLPQSVILWTTPDPLPERELTLIPQS